MASRTTTDPIEILLEMGVDLDNLSEEEDYLSALKEAIATIQFQTKGGGDERSTILQQEVVKVRKKRKEADPKFKARKTKISADSFKKGTATTDEVRQNVRTGVIDPSKLKFSSVNVTPKQKALPTSAIVQYQAPQTQEEPEKAKAKGKKKEKPRNLLAEIAKSVTNIADTLKKQYNLKKKEGEFDRKKAQRDKRKLDEKNLEKGFGTILKSAQKIIKPVQGFFDKIFNFIKQILIGKFLIGLVNWISKPENQKKLFNIIDFLGKHWKKLLSLYLVFGTGLGRFVFGLTKLLISGAIKLGAAIAKLLAVKGLKRFAGVARFLGGSKGKLIATGAATALTVGGTMMGLGSLGFSGGGEVPQVQGYAGGGTVEPSPTKEDGPLNFIMNMSGAAKGAALGSLLGPLGTLAGAGIGSLFDKGKKKDDSIKLSKPAEVELEVPSEPSGTEGQVDGPGGTDKVPAMLTAGEFVMSRGAVQKYGVKTLESMNAAGGGTNQPKIVNNKVYASVGGYVGNAELGKKGTPDPEKEESSGGGKTAPSIPSSAIKSSVVLALKNGIQGKLNTLTGKFTPKAFTEAERSRYTHFGGKIPEKPKKPERSDFPMGRSGAKKYQEALKSFKSSTSTVTSETPSGPQRSDFSMGRSGAKKYQEAKKSFEASAATSKVTPKVTPTTQTPAPLSQATKRHAELIKSTNPQKIADYDAKHGAGAYSKKLQEKLNKIYPSKAPQSQPQSKVIPTGKVVGRENLSPKAQKALARLDAQKAGGKTPDMQYTKNGKKISAEQFNKVKSGDIIPGGGKPGGLFGGMMDGAKNMLGGMFGGMGKPPAPAPGQKVIDGNKLPPTAEEQRYLDEDKAARAKMDTKYKARDEERSKTAAKQAKHDRLFGEYRSIVMNEDHPLHRKVAGDLFTDDEGMKFEDFKKLKSQQAQVKPPAKVAPTPPKVSAPEPPQKPAVSVVKVPSKKQQGGQRAAPKGGSRTPQFNAGSGSSSKRKILGIF